jgi:hypothetical protein
VRLNEELQGQVDERTKRIFGEGEYVEDWQDTGVDLAAVLQERPGGPKQNFLYAAQAELVSSQNFHPHDGLLGPEYRTFFVDGPEELFSLGTIVGHSLTRVAPGVWVAMATEYAKTGNALCAQRTAVRLHARRAPGDLSASEAGNLASLVAGSQRINDNPQNCGVWVPAGDSQRRTMHFTPAGTRLPAGDRSQRPARIASLSDARRLLSEE